jgi:hypothetical protein
VDKSVYLFNQGRAYVVGYTVEQRLIKKWLWFYAEPFDSTFDRFLVYGYLLCDIASCSAAVAIPFKHLSNSKRCCSSIPGNFGT